MNLSRRSAIALAGIAATSRLTVARAAEDVQANKAAAKRYIDEVWNKRSLGVIDEIFSPEFIPTNDDEVEGLDALKQRLDQTLEYNTYSVEDIQYEIVVIAGEAENVFIRGLVTGKSSSAKKIKAPFFVHLKFDGGLIVSELSVFDQLAMIGV